MHNGSIKPDLAYRNNKHLGKNVMTITLTLILKNIVLYYNYIKETLV